ncbi:MAG TPA: methyltransferase [Thermodesulfovibrionales bacterium]|nr:methyltransferase [Thermodesulfovibrionales bacterium]
MDFFSADPNQEMRQFNRKPFVTPIGYTVNILTSSEERKLNLRGRTIDISDVGVGIETDHPLAPGHTLFFDDESGLRTGVVRWCMKLDDSYRAGIVMTAKRKPREQYREERGQTLFVHEERERYHELLDRATEQFNRELEDLERRCSDPQEDSEDLFSLVSRSLTTVCEGCEEFERGVRYDKSVIKAAQMGFREKTNPILSKSYFINRARIWPQGCQGDYKTLEGIYKNTPMSEGIGYYLDQCALFSALAIGVRERIIMLRELLKEELLIRENPKVLDIACGSCREVFELAADIEKSGAHFTCIDLDSEALTYSLNRMSYADPSAGEVEFLKYNAIRMFDHELNIEEFGMQDIIYSVGFFDYLPDDFLVKLLHALYQLLNPGGKLIMSFKDASLYKAQFYHWIVDWDGFLQRNKADFGRLLSLAGIPETALTDRRVESDVIIFYTATK